MPRKTRTSSPSAVSGATNPPIFPTSSPLSSPGSTSKFRSNPPTPPTKPATPPIITLSSTSPTPPIITLSSTSPTPQLEVPPIPGHFIKEISDLSETEVILEIDHIYSIGKWPKSSMVFQDSSASLLCLTVFGPHATISAYKQENTVLHIYLPSEITNPNVEGESAEVEYVPITLSSSGLSNDGLFTAAKDAWALYRDDEGVLEQLLVKFPPPPAARACVAATGAAGGTSAAGDGVSTAGASGAAARPGAGASTAGAGVATPGAATAAAVSVENEDEEAEGELIRITRGDEAGWMKFLVEVNDWKGWAKEEVKQGDGELESGQLHVKVQAVLK